MAPYQSLLPVRKHKVPPSGLPRLKPSSSSTSINNAPPAPPRPLEPIQSRLQEDVSTLDFGNLLGGPGDEEGFGLLNDEEVPDFLVDQSMWTVGGRTPARKGQERGIRDLINEEEVEEEDDAGIAQYDDSDGDLPAQVCEPSTPVPSTSSAPISFAPQPVATPSFHHSPNQHGQALFDELEPSMNGDYTSTSNRSESFARNDGEQEEDSTFTLERDPEVTPCLSPPITEVVPVQENQPSSEPPELEAEVEMDAELAKTQEYISECGKGEAEESFPIEAQMDIGGESSEIEDETRNPIATPDTRVEEEQIEEPFEGQPQEEEEEITEAAGSDETIESSLELAGPVGNQESEEDESHLRTNGEGSALLEEEHEEYEDGQETRSFDEEEMEGNESIRMEVQVPVKFGDEGEGILEDSSISQVEEEEQLSSIRSPRDTRDTMDDQVEPLLEEASAVSQQSRPSLSHLEAPLSRHSSSPNVNPALAIPALTASSTIRPPPSFQSNAVNLGSRHSIGGSRPVLGLAFKHQAQRRRQSVSAIVTLLEWNKRESRVEKQDEAVGLEVDQNATIGETSVNTETSVSSLIPRHSLSPTSDAVPDVDSVPSVPSNPRTPADEHATGDSTDSSHRSQELSFVPLSPRNTSIPLSPTSHDASLEADTTLPAMGAPLDFHRSIGEIGHSTPAKSHPRRILQSLPGMTEATSIQPKGGRFDIETIEEVTEEESSFEIIRERSAQPSQVVVKPEEEEEEEEIPARLSSSIIKNVESEEEAQAQLAEHSQSSTRAVSEPANRSTTLDLSLQPEKAGEAVQSQSEERAPCSEGPASHPALPLPLPIDTVPSISRARQDSLSTSIQAPLDFSHSRPPLPTKRSVRVSLAAPPPNTVLPKTARRASTSMISSAPFATIEQSRRARENRPVRVSLAAPPPPQPSTTARTYKRPRVSRTTVTQSIGATRLEKLQPENETSSQPVVESLPEESRAIQQPSTTEESVQVVEAPAVIVEEEQEEEALSIGPAQIPNSIVTEEPQPATSPNLPPAPLPASASSNKQTALTLPTTFSFASNSTGLTREQERQKRKEERERRERRVEEALKAKKQSMQRGSGWKKPEVKKDPTKRKAVESDRNVKRSRMEASSDNGSAASRRPPLKTSTLSSIARKPSESALPVQPQPPSVSSTAVATAQDPTTMPVLQESAQSVSSPALKLTKATLEANRVATGPRIDLKRRISSFLDSLEDETSISNSESADHQSSVDVRVGEEKTIEHEKVEAVPPAPRPPPLPPRLSRPPSRAGSNRSEATSSRPIAGPRKRKPLASSSTTTAKPFTFAAPRAPRNAPPAAPSSNASTASPMFLERLSTWKAREQEALRKGKRKAPVPPPPMPFRSKNVQSAPLVKPTNPSISTSVSAQPPTKRPRVEAASTEQGRGGKENANSQRSTKPVVKDQPRQKKPEKPAVKAINGGVVEEMEKRLKEKLEWSERQKKREEEVRKRKEAQRAEEAEQERKKLQALRAALTVDRHSGPVRVGARTTGRPVVSKRV
ncbi:hypothetical protein JCM5350_000593 [Sporobolomyces pararoseus]